MDQRLATMLHDVAADASEAVPQCLAGAERAVDEGRFNVAKILRAVAHSARVRALDLERLPLDGRAAVGAVEGERTRRREEDDKIRAALALVRERGDGDLVGRLQRVLDASASLDAILDRAVASLRTNRDVLESDVAQSLWGCHDCGHIAEGSPPDGCPVCGALAVEFEWFGPFYAGTAERLGLRRPDEIVAILQRNAGEMAQLFRGLADEVLRRRPSPEEWCMKEIGGHMLDVTELFSRRARALLGAESIVSIDTPVPPWKLLEGKGYAEATGADILDRFRRATDEALAVIEGFERKDWGRQGLVRGRATSIRDLGTWLANHNVAHLKQIEALREAFG